MLANCCTVQAALFNPKTLKWTPTGKGKFDTNNEEGWTLLPNTKVLTVDAYVPLNIPYDPTGTNSRALHSMDGHMEQRRQHDCATVGFSGRLWRIHELNDV